MGSGDNLNDDQGNMVYVKYLIFKYFDLFLDLQCDMIRKAFVDTSRLSRYEFASNTIKFNMIVLMISSHFSVAFYVCTK